MLKKEAKLPATAVTTKIAQASRHTSMNVEKVDDQGTWTLAYRDAWIPLERDALPALIAFFERQAGRFRKEAAHVQVQLETFGQRLGNEALGPDTQERLG